jgi:hypothetical protein
MPGMRQSELFIEGLSEKLSSDLLALGRTGYRLVTGLLTAHCTLRQHLHVMSLLDNAICRKCGQEEESYHIVCQCPALAGHKMKIFGSAWVEPQTGSGPNIEGKALLNGLSEIRGKQ